MPKLYESRNSLLQYKMQQMNEANDNNRKKRIFNGALKIANWIALRGSAYSAKLKNKSKLVKRLNVDETSQGRNAIILHPNDPDLVGLWD